MMRSDEIETIQSIKDKTRYYIEQCSPESNIRYTDYFNHTFIPDMVIDWNKQERYLYIRTTSDINWIFEDAKLLDIFHPIILTIEDFSEITDKSTLELQSKTINSLISNTMTLGMPAKQNREQTIYKIVNYPIPQYGRGLFTKPLATKTAQDFIDGTNAAESLNGNQVAQSLQTMHQVMSNDGRNQIDSFYQALWCGHGGAITDYPSPALLEKEINDEGWDYLLSHSDENTQWSSIPAKLTLSQTSQLNAQKHPYSFNSLIAGKANTIAVKAAKVVRTPPSLFSESAYLPFWHWTIDEKHLIATNGTTQIIFSDSTEDIKKMYESENIAMHEGLDVDTFIHRVAGLKIQRVQVDNRDTVW